MKTKDIKYKEAVVRNIANAKRNKVDKYKGKDFHNTCRALGVRVGDSTWDKEITELVGKRISQKPTAKQTGGRTS